MKRILSLAPFVFFTMLTLSHGGEQPPYEVKDPAISENFREAYRLIDRHRHLGTDESSLLVSNTPSSGTVLMFQGYGVVPIAWNILGGTGTWTGGQTFYLLTVLSTFTVSGGTLTATNGARNWLPGCIIQSSATAMINSSSGTTSNNFAPAGMTVTITPLVAPAKIEVNSDFELNSSSWTVDSCYATILKNGVDASGGSRGQTEMAGGPSAKGASVVPTHLYHTETITSISALTYTVALKNSVPGGITCTAGSNLTKSIFEVKVIAGNIGPN